MNRTSLFLLAAILAFATALRVFNLSALGYWTDEFCTLSEAHGHGLHVGDVPTDRLLPPGLPVYTRLSDARPAWLIVGNLRREDTHPPLYFLLVRLWEDCFGDGESAVRSLDVCFSVAAVGLLYFAAEPDVGSTAALWACLVMAVASPQIQFAQEARNYAPVLTFGLGAVIAARRLSRGPTEPGRVGPGRAQPASRAAAHPAPTRPGSVIALAACLLAMMLTHYYAAGIAAALAVHVALTVRGRPQAYTAAAFAVAAVAFLILWGPAVLPQLASSRAETAWLVDPVLNHAVRTVWTLARLPVRWVADVNAPASAAGGALLLLLPLAYARRPPLRLWVLWVAIPTALVAAGDFARSTTQMTLLRYTLFATPGAYVLIAAAVPAGWWRSLLPAAAVIGALLALPSAYVPPWKVDFRTPTQFGISAADGLVISGPDPVAVRMAVGAFQHYLPRLPGTTVVLTRPADDATLAALSAQPRVWVVWLWSDRPIRAFLPRYQVADAGSVPHFGQVAVGRFVRPTSGPR